MVNGNVWSTRQVKAGQDRGWQMVYNVGTMGGSVRVAVVKSKRRALSVMARPSGVRE